VQPITRSAVSVSVLPPFQKSDVWKRRLRHRAVDLTGQRFGDLVVLTYAGYYHKTSSILWLCQCDCGERNVVRTSSLRHGKSKSCGCGMGWKLKHGHSDSRTYSSYRAMMRRCYKPKTASYKHYGGRGICVCARWHGPQGFINFLADLGERPRGKTIDRKDVDGNYCPQNCRWATKIMQENNKRPRKQKPLADDFGAITGFAEPF